MAQGPTSVNSIDSADALLKLWDNRLTQIDDSLVALESEPTYQLLCGASPDNRPSFEGESASVAQSVVDSVSSLFEDRHRLSEVVELARKIRADISVLTVWNTDGQLAQISGLLLGQSIDLSGGGSPLSRRTLLANTSVPQRISPEILLAQMDEKFSKARDHLVLFRKAFDSLENAMNEAKKQLDTLAQEAELLGVKPAFEQALLAQKRSLDECQKSIDKDPIFAQHQWLNTLVVNVGELKSEIETLRKEKLTAEQSFASLIEAKNNLLHVHEKARTAFDLCSQELSGVDIAKPLTDSDLTDLFDWFNTLEARVKAGPWHSVLIGLEKWQAAAQSAIAREQSICDNVNQQISLRDELVGRLAARRAQANALAHRKILISQQGLAAAEQARHLFVQRPTPLAAAISSLEAFERAIEQSRHDRF